MCDTNSVCGLFFVVVMLCNWPVRLLRPEPRGLNECQCRRPASQKQTTSSRRRLRGGSEAACRNSSCPRLDRPSRRERERGENEEHLHLNGMFFLPLRPSRFSICLVMTLLPADRGRNLPSPPFNASRLPSFLRF